MNIDDRGAEEFKEFAQAGEVEVGESNLASQKGSEKEAPKDEEKPAGKPADEDEGESGAGDEDEGESGAGDEDEEQEEKPEKKKRQPSDRIRELSRRVRDKDRVIDSLAARLEAIEKGGLPKDDGGGKSRSEEVQAPDPTDTAKYPLGHLDDRYIEDKLEWLADKKAADRADAALQRQQEGETIRAAEKRQQELLSKVDDLAKVGDELFDDFQEKVVETGMKGEWDLSQPTFEAAHEVENGAQILYELSQDKKEATRVAQLSPYQQMKFVEARDAEIKTAKIGRKIPKADPPPENRARGASSRTLGNPATDNLEDFAKQWERDAKKPG